MSFVSGFSGWKEPVVPEPANTDLLADFADLQHTKGPGRPGVMILEGATLIERALGRGLVPRAVLCEGTRHEDVLAQVPPGVPVFHRTRAELETLCGFRFHRGLLVSADCPVLPETLDTLPSGPAPLLVLPEINDPENLGSLLRTAAAFGVAGVLLGERCPAPFSRRVLRVSMGAALELPLVHCRNLRTELERLRDLGLVLLGSSARRGQPPAELDLADTTPRALLLGNEGQGLATGYAELCHSQLRIPLGPAVSSLNVALAAGILLYELTGRGRHVSGARP